MSKRESQTICKKTRIRSFYKTWQHIVINFHREDVFKLFEQQALFTSYGMPDSARLVKRKRLCPAISENVLKRTFFRSKIGDFKSTGKSNI